MKPTPGTISISVKHSPGPNILLPATAHYTFPDVEFTESAFEELRRVARRLSNIAADGRLPMVARHRSVACGNCGAKPGEQCIGTSGKRIEACHLDRKQKARKL